MPVSQVKVIYEDAHLLALNKPALLHSTARDESTGDSLADWLKQTYPSLKTIGGSAADCGLVQRLDFETSGLILAAKSQKVWDQLHSQLCSQATEKSYLLLCQGFAGQRISVRGYAGQRYRRSKKMSWSSTPLPGYSPVETSFERLSSDTGLDGSLLIARLAHALRHQVRISAAAGGFPLCGDTLYGSKVLLPDNLPKFLLHALSAKLLHPQENKILELRADPPLYFSRIGWNNELLK